MKKKKNGFCWNSKCKKKLVLLRPKIFKIHSMPRFDTTNVIILQNIWLFANSCGKIGLGFPFKDIS